MNKFKVLLTIFFITFTTILIEILYTRLFAVIYYSSFAFLMISLALFGYGLSGFYMSLYRVAEKKNLFKYLENFILIYGLVLPIIYKLTLVATIDFSNLFNPVTNILLLLFNFMILTIPFFAAGVILVLLFTHYSSEIGKLYFIDLIGAALGGLAIIPLITQIGPSNLILFISLILILLWGINSISRKAKQKGIILLGFVIIFGFLFLKSDDIFPIVPKAKKRGYLYDLKHNWITYDKWSPINKIDVGPPFKGTRKIWIDGGTMQSSLFRVTPGLKNLKPMKWIHAALPYQLASGKDSAFIIGSAGGLEVLCALSHKFKHIVAVEMDPEICNLVVGEFAEYIGHIFTQPEVRLLNDEGRSVLKRLGQKYDVIQMVNSHNSDALLSGGLSIAETYIYTVEAFKDYWNHLNKNGFLAIVHWFGERMFTTAYQALKELGVEDPEKKLLVIQPRTIGAFGLFFMKKGNFFKRDYDIFNKLTESRGRHIAYAPDRTLDNIYYKLISGDFEKLVTESSVSIFPVRDHSPYFNQCNKIGQFSFDNNYLNYSGGDTSNLQIASLKYSNSVYLSILFASLLFALLFIYLPLKLQKKGDKNKKAVLYFFLIGFAFIMVEIILIKVFQLFMGNPAYSISVIIFSLLVSTGIGSLLSERINRVLKKNTILYLAIFLFGILLIYALVLFKIVYILIHFPLLLRFLFSLILISLLGVPMGVFFPTGLRLLGKRNKELIGWAWGSNAFATVLGSVCTVIIAINYNFSWALITAGSVYLLSGIIMVFLKGGEAG